MIDSKCKIWYDIKNKSGRCITTILILILTLYLGDINAMTIKNNISNITKNQAINQTDNIIKCAKLGLTEFQTSFMTGVPVDNLYREYAEMIKNNLPSDYKEKRWKRFYRFDPAASAKFGNEYWSKNKDKPLYRLTSALANQISIHCNKRGIDRNGKAFKLLRFSVGELKSHLESLFEPWMSWDNYGLAWQIDHKTPVSWFKFKTVNEKSFHDCWCLKNLQPLSKTDNLAKGNRWSDA